LGTSRASKLLGIIHPQGAAGLEPKCLAVELLADLRRLDRDLATAKRRVSDAVTASGTSLLELHGVGPIVAGFILGYAGDPARFLTPERFATCNGTAPIEASSGPRKRHRLNPRGNRRTTPSTWPRSPRSATTHRVAPTTSARSPRESASSVPGLMRRIVVIVAAGLLLGACGDDDDGATPATTAEAADHARDADVYVEAVASSWNETSELPLDERQTTCVARGLVDVVGVDALTEAGISPDEFAAADELASLGVELPGDATAVLGAALGECDVVETLEGIVIAAFPDEFGVQLPPDAATCLTDHLDDQAVADGWAATFIDGSDERLQRLVSSSMGACPAVATAVLIATAPTELTPEAEACIGAFVQDNPELVMETLASGESPATATQELGEQMAAACPEAIGG
jgi:hypothetical protein